MSEAPIAKLVRNAEAKAWLKKHANDPIVGGGLSSCLPFHNFTRILNYDRKATVDAIAASLDQLSPRERHLAEDFLASPPRFIARYKKKSRRIIYQRLRKLIAKCLRIAEEKRAGYINQRAEDQSNGPDTTPATIAARTLVFTLGDRTATAYLVEREGVEVWCDEDGRVFSDEVSDILRNHEEDLRDSAFLEVVEG